ncbi:AMP deaminase-like isoform X3 [Chenopodium quinoa]|uniref:AMP deaminase-like isoform X3 n=1 Tax=Chenopodium quinoa TaxID=63459 RepID=UPI000B79804E|nr:AMP deaminase-like isoform X3 [Chenopodium quinoa]
MEPSPSMVHLAMAAFFGASLMAISALFIHKRSVDQILERLIEVRRRKVVYRDTRLMDGEVEEVAVVEEEEEEELGVEDYGGDGNEGFNLQDDDEEEEREVRGQVWGVPSKSGVEENLDMNLIPSYGISSSVPNFGKFSNDWVEDDSNIHGLSSSLDKSHLPLLHRYLRNADGCSSVPLGDTVTSNGQAKELNNGDPISSQENNSPDSKVIVQKSPALPIGYENHNTMQDQKSRVAACERKAILDLPANVEIDMPSTVAGGNDAETILPLKAPIPVPLNVEEEEVQRLLRDCLELREAYVYKEQVAPWNKPVDSTASGKIEDPFHFSPVEKTNHDFRMEDGVVHVYASKDDMEELFPVPSATQFFTDMHQVLKVVSNGNVSSACYHRLRFLEEKFRLYLLVNADREFLAQKSAPHRDFYNIRKVDTHIHHSACMNQKHLLRFIKSKLRKEPDEVVIFRDGKYLTLKEVFESLDLTGYDLNVDLLDVHADKTTFHRFDKFNLKYNPCGQSRLREIFLKQDNLIQGRFLAEVTKEVLVDLEASKYQMAEYRISVYGRKQSEWDQLASWFINNEIYSENAVWLIQLPRLYNVYKNMGIVTSFQNIIDNIFIPLFEVTVDPNSHPQLHVFLMQVVGFDLVDDESKPERRPTKHMPTPAEWTNEFNPAFAYYTYYVYANLYTLNKLRESKGFPTIKLRPHCGEAGDVDHLSAGFLLCHNISHGINLRKSPVLQYLYYLAQIGLAMSPLSNNSLFLDYHRNPFPMFFQRGLNVSLSSDDPLQIHLTKEALVEEYSVAAQVWKLSACDLCEVARNSVYQSGFSHAAKLHWLGGKYFLRGPESNDIHKTNVPKLRIAFRHETWKEEMQYVYSGKARIPEEINDY